ncbi:Na+/H+-dicarboxylate symporter [Bradyrhizobium diazoefficiens]
MTQIAIQPAIRRRHQPWYKILYIQVLIAIVLGVLIGYFYPDFGKELKPLGDGFIALIKMMIAPVIFCTVVHGISSMGDLKRVGRVGLKSLIYFESVSTVALAVGLLVGEVLQPGHGFNIDPATIDPKSVATYVTKAKEEGIVAHLMAIIPDSYVGAIARGDLLQVLLISILSGFAIAFLGKAGEPIADAIDKAAKMFFGIIRIIVRVAPVGAFGAMAFTVGAYGLGSLLNLAALIGTFYLTSMLFVLIVLGAIARLAGFSILRFIAYIKDELLIVLGTSSSETVLPQMIQKMEHLGRLPLGGRPRHPDRLQLQPRRHQHLHDAGNAVSGAGDQHASDDLAGARHPRHRHDHLEGRLGRDRRRLHHARRDALDRA